MFTNHRQFDSGFAKKIAGALVWMWPAESKEWALAFEAEFSVIETGGNAFSWLMGGVMLLLRERWKHFLQSLGRPAGLDAGSSAEFSAKNYSRVPRTPLWITALLLLATAAILIHPEVRTALGSLYSVYAHTEGEPSRWASVNKLNAIASTNRDPQLIALLSLLSNDEAVRLQLSEEAIHYDASFTWLDYEQSLLPFNDLSKQHYLPEPRLRRLQKWDSQNAIPHLLTAEMISHPIRAEAFDALMHGDANQAWAEKLAQNPNWISEMSAAFSAPNYDNYSIQTLELIRSVGEKYSVRDPDIALFVLSHKRTVQFDVARVYSAYLLKRGGEFSDSGNIAGAEADFTTVLHFSQRMLVGYQFPFEQYFAQGMGARACEKLQTLYQSTGRTNEAALVAFQLAEWNQSRDTKLMRYMPSHYREAQWNALAWSGLQLNLAGIVLAVLAPLALLSLLYAWWRRSISLDRRGRLDFWSSVAVDGLPWILLASSALLYFVYHPYAQTLANSLSPVPPLPELETFIDAAVVAHAVPDRIELIRDPFSLWFATTALLCLVGAWLIYRLTVRRNHSL